MDFSDEQKLIIALLTEVHSALEIEDGLDSDFIQRQVTDNRSWALHWRYGHLFSDRYENPPNVKFVCKVLDLWERIENSYSEYSVESRAELERLAPVFGQRVMFSGFDGNGGDRDGYGIAQTLVGDLGRWNRFRDRDLNAHCEMSPVYERMLSALASLNKDSSDYFLSVDEMAELLNAQAYPR